MQRYNIFNQVHKGLRAMLYDMALQLQHTCFANKEAAEAVFNNLETVINTFQSHAMHEDKFILPAIQTHDYTLAEEFEKEHVKDEYLSRSLNNLMAAYFLAANEEARVAAGYALTMAFNEFVAFNLYHMNKEEDKINKCLWRIYTDAELVRIARAIINSIPQDEIGLENMWMMRGINNTEIKNWLCAVKNNAPGFVFSALLCLAEKELPEQRWNEIKEDLMEGMMMA